MESVGSHRGRDGRERPVVRSLAFYQRDLVLLPFRARFPGDTMIILGTLVFTYDVLGERFVVESVSAPDEAAWSGVIPRCILGESDD